MLSKDDGFNCSNPPCGETPLVVVEATEEMLEASTGLDELAEIAEMFDVSLNNIGIGLCPTCSMTYYIAL